MAIIEFKKLVENENEIEGEGYLNLEEEFEKIIYSVFEFEIVREAFNYFGFDIRNVYFSFWLRYIPNTKKYEGEIYVDLPKVVLYDEFLKFVASKFPQFFKEYGEFGVEEAFNDFNRVNYLLYEFSHSFLLEKAFSLFMGLPKRAS
ncbi:MAG: hypothetical protein NC926_09180 [Candidatus Omnitrophica bacterium]|nr:hypothetical protein [Candidatus Omnitrophota bacterium]